MIDERFYQLLDAIGVSAKSGHSFGLTEEQTLAQLDAFRDAASVGGDAFLAAVDRETQMAALNAEPLTVAEQLRLEARQAVAFAIEEYFTREALEAYDGPVH